MNYDNYNDENSCLNAVNITSNVRAPGEYKYYYCGENNSSSDKSFLSISTMWYTTKISEDMFLLSSNYTTLYTCLLYYCPKKSIYNIYVYQNSLDYKSENICLKPIQIIQLQHSYKAKDIIISKSDTTGQPVININVKIYFGADNYLLLNEIDRRILLIDFINGNYVTIFSNKEQKSQEPSYNIIDTYDENYIFDGETRLRTYAFLSIKYQEKKLSYYKYRYFIVERGILENNFFFLHSIDLDMGNGEPLGLKIAKIPKQNTSNNTPEDKNQQWFYILCFLSSQRLFQLITNYDKLTLYQMLRNINQCNTIVVPSIELKANTKSSKCSMTTIGFQKENQLKKKMKESDNSDAKESNSNVNNSNISLGNKNSKQIYFWSTSINLWLEKKQVAQSVKIFLNINTKRLCALILFFEIGEVASFPFNYNDSPEEIKNKITVTTHEIQLDKIRPDSFGSHAKVYKFEEHYFFKSNTICALTSKNLILAIDNKFRIYDLETNAPLYSYNFYKENIAAFLLFDDIGATFLLTWTKVFKIIFNTRYKIFSESEIKNNPKCPVRAYISEGMNYPLFEDRPEDIWNSYCNKLEIDSTDNKKILYKDTKLMNSLGSNINSGSTNNETKKRVCVICSKEAEYYCSDCELKYYCSNEHFKYDYNNTHFFECQLVQFFKRKDIMSIENKEIRYMVLYNELIKLCGRILNFTFTRIFNGKDCHCFLEMLLNLIALLDNFGFYVNFAEFCSCNLFPSTDKNRPRPEKILFYQECIYFYAQLQILKCTFTSKCKLYNLTDCYLKIIKNDIIPKLTPKSKKKIIPLRCDKLKKILIFQNEYFQNFQSPVFFDLRKSYNNAECTEYVDIVENYIMKHLMTLSILVKFKMKLHSSIDVKDTFVDISLMFDDHFREIKSCKNVVPYCYFSVSFYLVQIGKVPQTVKLLKKMVNSFSEKSDTKLKALTFFNLGVLQYALGEFKIGIHNIEVAYKLIVDCFLSEKFKHRVMVSLGLAYLNQRNLFKAYVLIQTSIRELKKIRKQKYELKCVKLNVYLNYIIDLYEYSFITKARLQTNKSKKDKNYNIHQLINFVEGGNDKELIVIEQHVTQFLKVVEYIWNLPNHILQNLQIDNPPKPTINYREEVHHGKNLSFTMEQSQMSTFLIRETGIEKEESTEEYDEDIEVKPQLFDSLTRQQQKDFKELKTVFLKRDIILRDSLGAIEKFNINFDPVYSIQFQKIIEKLKSNFLLKDIFYCFQNEKWRDELYNYSPNNLLFGLSKYLKLEKIKNVIAIEKSKCLDIIKKEKNDSKERNSINRQFSVETDLLKKINTENNIYPNSNILLSSINNPLNLMQNNNNSSLLSRYRNEELNYLQFKKKFADALKENEKNKTDDKFQYLSLKEDYLVSLYKNVYLNNPENNFIFQNPSLILNYIFIDISNNDTNIKEANELILKQKMQEDENNKLKNRKSNSSFLYTKNASDPKKEENNKFSSSFKNSNIRNPIGEKEAKDEFDHSRMIVSPILEETNYRNYNYDYNIQNKISSESKRDYTYFFLKFDIVEDNLKMISNVCQYNYFFVRKKLRSITSSWGLKSFFGKKKKAPERKSLLPDLFLKFSGTKTHNKGNSSKKGDSSKNENKRKSMISSSYKINNNESNIGEKKKTKKKEKSCNNLHERLSVNFLNENNDIIREKIAKIEYSSECEDMSQSKTTNNNIKEIKSENENESSENKNAENNNNLEDKNLNNNNVNNSKSENNKDIKNNNNNNINNENDIQNNNNNNNKINFKNLNYNVHNDNIILLNQENELFDISTNYNGDKIKNGRKKLKKTKSMKQLNNNSKYSFSINNNNIQNRRKYKQLTINTKKALCKPKTYNFFSPGQLKQEEDEEEDNINNFYGNKKISFYSMSQKKMNKNYGFKSKKEQEKEIVNGAIEYLQQEFNNKNRKNIKENHIFNSIGISMETMQHKLKFNDQKVINKIPNKNKNNYKVPYDYQKKGKQFGEESTTSLNSTSSGYFILNNNSFYNDDSSNFKKNSNTFQKELHRIINYNKKMKSNGEDIKNCNLKNNLNKNNKKMQKSVSQPNFFEKKNLNMENEEKSIYSKGKLLSKTNKVFTPLSKICKNNTNLDKTSNTGITSTKNYNLNGNINSSNNNNINYSKFNIKSNKNKNSNIISNSNIRLKKDNTQKSLVEFFQEEQQNYKNKSSSHNYKDINKKDNKKDDKKENDNDNIENNKFRFVLDKYIKQKKPNPNCLNKEKKEEKKIKNNSLDNHDKNLNKHENSNFCSSIFEKNNKEKNNNEKIVDSLFNEAINTEKLCNLKENDDINNNNSNKENIFEEQKLNISNIKQKQETISNSNLINNEEYINNLENNGINNNNIKDNMNEPNKNESKIISLESSCDGLGDDTDLKEKINMPFQVTPLFKNNNKNNMREHSSNNNSKNDNNESYKNNNNPIENIMNQSHLKPQKLKNN